MPCVWLYENALEVRAIEIRDVCEVALVRIHVDSCSLGIL
jgi:hypothetical protein